MFVLVGVVARYILRVSISDGGPIRRVDAGPPSMPTVSQGHIL
jgi:hypothetical protein